MSAVCKTSGESGRYVMWDMPLSLAGFFYAQACKESGMDKIGRKTDYAAAFANLDKQMNRG